MCASPASPFCTSTDTLPLGAGASRVDFTRTDECDSSAFIDAARAGGGLVTVGIDVGAEAVKVVALAEGRGGQRCIHRSWAEHHKQIERTTCDLLAGVSWSRVHRVAVTGRHARKLALPLVPVQQAQAAAVRFWHGNEPRTAISIGSRGFSVLETRPDGDVFRENGRCSQGTGNFLRQLVERLGLSLADADALARDVTKPAVLSGRCPVILKTDMTHLANKGEDKGAILAGLFDAVCDNVLVLVKPEQCARRVLLFGGVARLQRIRDTLSRRLQALGLDLADAGDEDSLFAEATGTALIAAHLGVCPPPLPQLFATSDPTPLEIVALDGSSPARVRRLSHPPVCPERAERVVLGIDVGSTGAKMVVLDARNAAPVWETYRPTLGDPVGAAQELVQRFRSGPAGLAQVIGFGVTGSGREIVGSLLASCYGADRVFVLNEIAAHAAGAVHHDARVDTIFEIGGQDAKYIRVEDGRVVDCAMNEACSAGTGSFIEEQGGKFAGVRDVAQLGAIAAGAREAVSLGQHCSVFMAEVIDEAVAAGAESPSIIAGLYDSVIQNYLNRVKGSRPVGSVIFCQGMPFSANALAAAVARQTGAEVIIPPSPGTVGALGIALLARPVVGQAASALDLDRFLAARVQSRDSFRCGAKVGCGGAGNHCRIERLVTTVEGKSRPFLWGGACALHDKGTRRRKLPDLAPDPFAERERLLRHTIAELKPSACRGRVAMTDEFALKGLYPFFAAFFSELGFAVDSVFGADAADLKRGIGSANVAFCAPMQLYQGLMARIRQAAVDFVFAPMIRSLPRSAGEPHAVTCPIVQASPAVVQWDLSRSSGPRLLSPLIDVGVEGLDSAEFLASCRVLASTVAAPESLVEHAWRKARAVQRRFELEATVLGRAALDFCQLRNVTAVVVVGRPYTLYNTVLNSNVPAILREQGAIGIPLDCYPIDETTPTFPDLYWAYGQRVMRAAHQVRRTDGQYAVYCSNYACGPDSFTLHFFSYAMAGKPSAVIETDGHSGDAGTKTRIEAFLHCVAQDESARSRARVQDFGTLQARTVSLAGILARRDRVLVPWMSDASLAVAAALRGRGVLAEALPAPDRAALREGRRHTSGKECLPMTLTLGSLLGRLNRAADGETFVYLMSGTCGPCRFGVYNLLNQIVLERLGFARRVRIWSPRDSGYFDEFSAAFGIVTLSGLVAVDLLTQLAVAFQAHEREAGAVDAVYQQARDAVLACVEEAARAVTSTPRALLEVTSGRLFGLRSRLRQAVRTMQSMQRPRPGPTVLLVGEIYVRTVPFANGFVARQLTDRGITVLLAPVHEWLEYCDLLSRRAGPGSLPGAIGHAVRSRIRAVLADAVEDAAGWPRRHHAAELLDAAAPFVPPGLNGEAVLTLGSALQSWRHGRIDGVVSVGPHECMPNKIAESQFFHLRATEGLPSLTVPLNGDPIDPAALDNFLFEISARWRQRQGAAKAGTDHNGARTRHELAC